MHKKARMDRSLTLPVHALLPVHMGPAYDLPEWSRLKMPGSTVQQHMSLPERSEDILQPFAAYSALERCLRRRVR